MQQYVVRRLLAIIPLMIGVSLVIFFVMRVLPGDVAAVIASRGSPDTAPTEQEIEAVRFALDLDRNIFLQYGDWVWDALRFDFGESYFTGNSVRDDIIRKLPVTIELGLLSILIAWIIALPVGIISAVKQDSVWDYAGRIFSISGLAVPTFWAGILTILILSRYFSWLPPLGYREFFEDPRGNLLQLIFPALALGWTLSATAARMTRSSMLEVLREDYIRTARSKGLKEAVVVLRHALRNALIPVITLAGFMISLVIGGTVVIESIFSLPGMGLYLVQAIGIRDFPIIQGVVLLIAFAFAIVNLLVDLAYGFIDPRIRQS